MAHHFKSPKLKLILALSSSCASAGLLTACGGNSSPAASPANAPVAIASCYDGSVDNGVGSDDPFAGNTWALKNTGPLQMVSAVNNNGVAGFDANVENVHKAGKGCTGRGVTIAIVDSGLELAHEDLAANVLANKSWNFDTSTSDPSPAAKQAELDHGTGVAGVAAAKGWNGKGSRGMAPNASLVGFTGKGVTNGASGPSLTVPYLTFGATGLVDLKDAVVALFGNRADAVDIFNYSAGDNFAAPPPIEAPEVEEVAAKWGTENLRSRKGALYFQAAGNEFNTLPNGLYPDGRTDSVNTIVCQNVLAADSNVLGGELSRVDGISCGNSNHSPSLKPYFFQVAAMHNTGVAASYSSAGASNWISGFGGEFGSDEPAMITTDNSGCDSGQNNVANQATLLERLGGKVESLLKLIADLFGLSSSKDPQCNYTGQMNGTSAATPSVAGVAALILEANPKLNWQDVGYILAKTAKKVDAGIVTGEKAVTFKPTGTSKLWVLDDPWITNQGGFNFQSRYGFGMVDAEAAVKLATRYQAPSGRRVGDLTVQGSSSTSTVESGAVGVHSGKATFSDSGTTGPMRVEFTLTNNTGTDINPGKLQFVLTNTTTGTRSILLPPFTAWYVGGKTFPIVSNGTQKFRFHTNAFYGEALAGTYTLQVIDFSGASGAAGKTLSFAPTLTSFSM